MVIRASVAGGVLCGVVVDACRWRRSWHGRRGRRRERRRGKRRGTRRGRRPRPTLASAALHRSGEIVVVVPPTPAGVPTVVRANVVVGVLSGVVVDAYCWCRGRRSWRTRRGRRRRPTRVQAGVEEEVWRPRFRVSDHAVRGPGEHERQDLLRRQGTVRAQDECRGPSDVRASHGGAAHGGFAVVG